MKDSEFSNLRVGSEVGMMHFHSRGWGILGDALGIVEKINGHGHITVRRLAVAAPSTVVFDKRGNDRAEFGHWTLVTADRVKEHRRDREIQKTHNEAGKVLETALKDCQTGSGNFNFTLENIDRLRKAVEELLTLQPK